MSFQSLLQALGAEIEDPEEGKAAGAVWNSLYSHLFTFFLESFLLFSQSIPSQNLGFVDTKATVLDLTIGGCDLSIQQSPTILSSNRGGGTTGAVVWKITPLFARWITSPVNALFKNHVLHPEASVIELGCGISGIIGLTLGSLIHSYILTDQDYVMKLLNKNLENNRSITTPSTSFKGRRSVAKPKRGSAVANTTQNVSNITTKILDWEVDEVTSELSVVEGQGSFDLIIACDCIYNDALIEPLVQTSVDICQLRACEVGKPPTICIVAQQLRSAEVFEGWLKVFHRSFRVWRMPDEELIDGLKSDSGFVVHIGMLR